MKIAEVVSSFYPNIGGIENAVYFLSEELAELGHEVHVITLDGKITHETIDGIHVHRLKHLIHLPLLPQKNSTLHTHACVMNLTSFTFTA